MNYKINNTVVKFNSNKPILAKSLIVFGIIFGYFSYIIFTKGFKNSVWEFVFVGISFALSLFFISLKSKIKNPFMLVKILFRTLSKKVLLDKLPVEISVTEEKIEVLLKSAEYFKRNVVDETFVFKKDDIDVINIYSLDNLVEIVANKATVKLKGTKYEKETNKGKTELFIYLHECGPEIFEKIIEFKYKTFDAKASTEKEKDYQRERQKNLEQKTKESEKIINTADSEKVIGKKQKNKLSKMSDMLNEMVSGTDKDVNNKEKF